MRKGFTIVEVMIAVVISGIVMAATLSAFRILVLPSVEEGRVTDAQGIDRSLAPAAAESIASLDMIGQTRADMADADWIMTSTVPEDTSAPFAQSIFAPIGTVDIPSISTPVGFTQFLIAAGYPLSSDSGFSVFGFKGRNELVSVLTYTYHDFGGFRFYSVQLRDGSSSVSKVSYSFCEPLTALQDAPACTLSSGQSTAFISITVPDPSSEYAKNVANLVRTYSDPAAVATARANLISDSSLKLTLHVTK